VFLYYVAENLIEPKNRGAARGEPPVEYDKEDGKMSFLGPKELFEELRTDESAMKVIRDRHSEYSVATFAIRVTTPWGSISNQPYLSTYLRRRSIIRHAKRC
jgi:hypothetical protein